MMYLAIASNMAIYKAMEFKVVLSEVTTCGTVILEIAVCEV